MSYKLINPSIEGQLVTTFKAKSDLDAANKAWTSISKYISNNVPTFAFTLENTKDGSLSHFLLKEKLDGKKNATYNISKLKVDADKKKEDEFRNRLAKQAGGRKHRRDKKEGEDDSSSSSSSSSSDIKLLSPFSPFGLGSIYNSYNSPISYWNYDPYYYNLNSLFIPTFVYPLTPYIEIMSLSYYPY